MHTYQEKGDKGTAVTLGSSAMGAKEGKRNASEGPQGTMVAYRILGTSRRRKPRAGRDDSSRLLPVLTAGEPNSVGTGDKEGLISSFNQDE